MAGHYFDSGALVKLYHLETGTAEVDEIVTAPANVIRISRLTVAELTSAFAGKVRTGAITEGDAQAFLLQFRTDIADGKFEVYSVGDSVFAAADRLISRHGFALRLRTLDALQLAVALDLASRGLLDYFVAADRVICEVARSEGLAVINPEGR